VSYSALDAARHVYDVELKYMPYIKRLLVAFRLPGDQCA